MKKRVFALLLVLLTAVSMTACGEKAVETQEVDYSMTFENQTGIDVSRLEIRYAEDAEWSEIALSGGIWENGYRIPVSMQGQMPVAENGWQVQVTFKDSDMQKVWNGVEFGDGLVFAFSMAEGTYETLVTVSEAEDITE
ncbi:MAG: hypothetical protein Q4C06_01115 [Bacillota bacterium]|nr:hypothetical protein [Bacillota bacterium]